MGIYRLAFWFGAAFTMGAYVANVGIAIGSGLARAAMSYLGWLS